MWVLIHNYIIIRLSWLDFSFGSKMMFNLTYWIYCDLWLNNMITNYYGNYRNSKTIQWSGTNSVKASSSNCWRILTISTCLSLAGRSNDTSNSLANEAHCKVYSKALDLVLTTTRVHICERIRPIIVVIWATDQSSFTTMSLWVLDALKVANQPFLLVLAHIQLIERHPLRIWNCRTIRTKPTKIRRIRIRTRTRKRRETQRSYNIERTSYLLSHPHQMLFL